MTAIEFQNVSKRFPGAGRNALEDLSFAVSEGEFVTVLGPSGCGKTTLLKLINRLYEPDSGRVLLFGEDIRTADLVQVRRRTGYVIQQIGLFPHWTIGENVATVPKLLKWDKARIEARTDELLRLVGLEPEEYKKRYPSQLSGGQQQRVGLARALAVDPKIMLMDEPFGALDSITRGKLQRELLTLHRETGKTFLFVTHDIDEAFLLGSRVLILDGGKIVQFDTPEAIIRCPAQGFVRSLVDAAKERGRFWEAYL